MYNQKKGLYGTGVSAYDEGGGLVCDWSTNVRDVHRRIFVRPQSSTSTIDKMHTTNPRCVVDRNAFPTDLLNPNFQKLFVP